MKKIYQVLLITTAFVSSYICSFSQTYTITTGLPLNLISGSGTTISSSGLGDDSFQGPFNIGFNFSFFNTIQTQFYMSANGYITFGSGNGSTGVGTIPNTSTPNNFIAYAATDQYPGASSSPIINYFVSGNAPNRICIINFQNIRHYSNSGLITSIQLQLFEASGTIEIHNIQNSASGYTRTIGIENSTGSAGFSPSGMNNSTSFSTTNTMIRFSTCSIPPVPVISPSTANTLCSTNPSISLSATCSIGNLSWSNGATTSTISVSPTQTTTYTATCTDNGCQSSSNILVPVLQTPTISPNGTNYICNGNTVNLTASAGVTGASFQWYKDGSSIINATNATLTVNTAGSYSVVVNKDACSGISALTEVIENSVTINPPVVSPSTIFNCQSTTTSLTATGCSGTVVWSNNSSGSILNVSISTSGTYSAICQVSGCGSSGVSNIANVNIGTLLISAAGSTQICPSSTVLLQSTTNVTPLPSYQWLLNGSIISGANSATYNAGNAGNYSLRINLPNGCNITSSQINLTVSNSEVPTITICSSTEQNSPLTRVWDRVFAGSHLDELKTMIKTPDNGYLLVGTSGSYLGLDKTTDLIGDSDAWVVKVDQYGNKLWDKSFGAQYLRTTPEKIIESGDGNYIICGNRLYALNNSNQYSYQITKISPNGIVIWNKLFNGNNLTGNYNFANDIIKLNDGYLVGGSSDGSISPHKSENSKGSADLWLIKIDFDGNKVWDKVIGGTNGDFFRSFTQLSDNQIIVSAHSSSGIGGDKTQSNLGSHDFWIVKIDENGNKIWDKTIGGTGSDGPKNVLKTSDNKLLIIGGSNSNQQFDKSQNSKGLTDIWCVKIDLEGNKIWDRTIGGNNNENITKGLVVSDGYIILGSTISSQGGDVSEPPIVSSSFNEDIWVVKLDNNGNKVWDKRFGTDYYDIGNDIQEIGSNKFLMAGFVTGKGGDATNKSEYTGSDYWLLSLQSCNTLFSPTSINPNTSLELIASGCPGAITWNTGQTTNIINVSPTQNTNYSVSCISNNNCTTQANVQVNVNCSSNFTVIGHGNNQNPVVCNTSPSVVLEASGCSGNILWSNGATSSSITVSPNATGTFSATCSGTSCIAVTKTINVIYLSNPTISTTNPTAVCVGQTVSLTASTNVTGGTLEWFLDGNSIVGTNSLVYSASATSTYSFKVSKDGCEAVSNTINITVNTVIPPKPTLTASTAYVCGRGRPVTLTASGCSGTVNWGRTSTTNNTWVSSPSGTTASAYINGKVKFYISCTESACTSPTSDSIEVDFSRVEILATDNIVCIGGSILLTANVYPSSLNVTGYQWLNGSTPIPTATNNTYIASTATTYNLNVTVDNTCTFGTYSADGGKNITLISSGVLPNPTFTVTDNSKIGTSSKVWDRRFGAGGSEFFRNILPLENGKYHILVGTTGSSGLNFDRTQNSKGTDDYWIIKIDSAGSKIWDKSFGTTGYSNLTKVLPMKNKGLLLVGYTDSNGGDKTQINYIDPAIGPTYDAWLIRVDSVGNKIWDKRFGGALNERLFDGVSITDNEFLLVGSTSSDNINNDITQPNRGMSDYWAIKIDSLGNKIWDKRYGGNATDEAAKIIKTLDNNYIIGGSSASDVNGDKTSAQIEPNTFTSDYWLVKIDQNGSKIWDKVAGGSGHDSFFDIAINNENDVFVTGRVNSDTRIIKLTSSGTQIWQKFYANSFSFERIIPNDKGILVAGSNYYSNGIISPPAKGAIDYFIVQLDSLGNKKWDKRFGGNQNNFFGNIVKTNKGYLLGGHSSSPISGDKTQPNRGSGSNDFWIVQINDNQEIPQPASINAGQSINLIANNCPGTVTWSGGTTGIGAMITVAPTTPTTYTATCSAYGCSTSSNITININCSANFIAIAKDNLGNPFPNPTVCSESPSVMLEATGCLGTITWSNGSTGSTTSVSPTTNTTYTATCSDVGCTSVDSPVLVKIFEIPTIVAAGTTTFCIGGSVILNATIIGSGYTFQWYKNGSTINNQTLSITVNESGTYQFMISKNGCSSISNSILVTVNSTIPTSPTYSSNIAYACYNTTIQLVANGCSGGQINWSNGSTGSTLSYLYLLSPPTTASFTSSCNVGGCQSPQSQPIIVTQATSKILNNSVEYVCNGNSVTLLAESKPNATYIWDGLSNQTSTSFTTSQVGYHILQTIYYPTCSILSQQVSLTQLPSVTNVSVAMATADKDTLFKIWDKVYGGTGSDDFTQIVPTNDGNYFVLGTSDSPISGNKNGTPVSGLSDYWLAKVTNEGIKIWDKNFGGNNPETSIKILKTTDGGYILIGQSGSGISGDKSEALIGNWDIWLIKIDEAGNKIWDKSIGTSTADYPRNATLLADGSIVIVGMRLSADRNNEDYAIYKVSAAGQLLWQKFYTGNSYDGALAVVETNDNGLLVSGYSNSGISNDKTTPSKGDNDNWLIKLNQNGDILWDKSIGGSSVDNGYEIIKTSDNHYFLINESSSPVSGDKTAGRFSTNGTNDIWIAKIDNNGTIIWDKTFGGDQNEVVPKGIILSNNDIIIGCTTSSNKSGTISEIKQNTSANNFNDIWILKVNGQNGTQIWNKRIEGNRNENFSNFHFINENELLVAGATTSDLALDQSYPTFNSPQCGFGIGCYTDGWLLKYNLKNKSSSTVAINLGQSVSLVASNCQGTVTWSNGMTGASIVVSPSENANYTASCNAFGCSTNSSIQVNINPCSQAILLTQADNILTGTSAVPIKVKAIDTINAINSIGNPPTNAAAKYAAGKSINLNAGFKVEVGSIFEAKISNTPCNE